MHQRRRAFLVVAGSAAIWLVSLQPWHWYMGDLLVYRSGGHAVLHREALYAVVSGRNHLHFTYPPFAAIPAAALDVMPLALAKAAISLASFASLVFSVSTYARRVETESDAFPVLLVPVVIAAAIWLEPVRATFSFGQINLVLMALIVADLTRPSDGRSAGVLIGLATAIKLTPGVFVVYFLVTGRIRQARNAAVSFACFTALGAVCEPSASRTFWLTGHFFEAHRVGRAENASNQSIRGFLARLLRDADVPAWWLALALVALAIGGVLAVTAHRRGHESQALLVVAIATLFASPISWSHHWVWCAIMPLACFDICRRLKRIAVWTAAAAVPMPFALGLVFWAPHTGGKELSDSPLQQLVSATYLLAGLILCGMIALDLRRGRADPARAPHVAPA